jgi:hypothetical protein
MVRAGGYIRQRMRWGDEGVDRRVKPGQDKEWM